MASRPRSGQSFSRRSLAVVIAVAALLAAALVAAAVLTREDGDGGSSGSATPVVDFDGVAQDGALLGSADATVRVIEYADLQCPACKVYAEDVLPVLVNDYVRSGRVLAEFRGLRFLGDDSDKALRFLIAAGLQNRLWNVQEALYRNQGAENSGWVTDDLLQDIGSDVPGLDVDRAFEDMNSPAVTRLIEEDEAQAEADGIPGTPTVLVQIGDDEPYAIDPSQLGPALDDALSS